jgi:hypothetical protein
MSRGNLVSKSEKILIHFPENKIAPKGGPAGYLFNLKLGLERNGAEEFSFLPAEKKPLNRTRLFRTSFRLE